MFKKYPELAVLKYTVIWMAMFWSTNVFALEAVEFQTTLIEHLEYGPAEYLGVEMHGMDPKSVDQALLKVYHENGLQPFWVNTNGPGEHATAIFEALKTADKHGLNPQDYHIDKIEKHWGSADVVGLVRLDILITLGLGSYVSDLREGRIEPRKIDPKLFATARDVEIDWNSLREQALSAPNMNEFLDKQVPPFAQYQKLQKALMKHREIKERGGWEFIPEGKVLKPGMEDERVRLIRKRLTFTGDLKSDGSERTTYDNELVKAVKQFQSRHGLQTDGVVGKETLSAMNVPVHTRIRQIIINMERYRWLKHQIGERALVVNIAGFMVAGIKPGKGEIEIIMPVIVGKQYHKSRGIIYCSCMVNADEE